MLTRRAVVLAFVVCGCALAAFAGARDLAREPARKATTGVRGAASVERVVQRSPAIRTGLPAVAGSMRPLAVSPARSAPRLVSRPAAPPPPASSPARGATAAGTRPAATAKRPAPRGSGGALTIIEVP